MKSKKDYISMLNDLGNSLSIPDLSDEEEREINNFLEQAEGYPVDVDLKQKAFIGAMTLMI